MPRKPCRSLRWEGSIFITFLIQEKKREQERARQPDQEPKGDDYVVIQRDSFYYLKNQRADSERQVDVLRKINEYERFIDGICLGLDVSGSSRGGDSRREGKPTVRAAPWALRWQTEHPARREEAAPGPGSSKV